MPSCTPSQYRLIIEELTYSIYSIDSLCSCVLTGMCTKETKRDTVVLTCTTLKITLLYQRFSTLLYVQFDTLPIHILLVKPCRNLKFYQLKFISSTAHFVLWVKGRRSRNSENDIILLGFKREKGGRVDEREQLR